MTLDSKAIAYSHFQEQQHHKYSQSNQLNPQHKQRKVQRNSQEQFKLHNQHFQQPKQNQLKWNYFNKQLKRHKQKHYNQEHHDQQYQ